MKVKRLIKVIFLGKDRVERYENIERRLKELDTNPDKLEYYRNLRV